MKSPYQNFASLLGRPKPKTSVVATKPRAPTSARLKPALSAAPPAKKTRIASDLAAGAANFVSIFAGGFTGFTGFATPTSNSKADTGPSSAETARAVLAVVTPKTTGPNQTANGVSKPLKVDTAEWRFMQVIKKVRGEI
jgi:hypothetical protein